MTFACRVVLCLDMRIKELFEKTACLNADDFSALIGEVRVILEKEREEGRTGKQVVRGGLVYLPLHGKVLVVGDLHGDMNSLIHILARSGYIEEENKNLPYLVFLGDYGDRGEESIEVYCLILKLKKFFRKKSLRQ